MFHALRTAASGRIARIKLRTASFNELNALSTPGYNPDLAQQFCRTGVCFIHIPKTGGTTIEKLLYSVPVHHRPWHEIYYLSPRMYEKWMKFGVIRNPIDRFLSSYDYLRSGGRNPIDAEMGRRFVRHLAINNFIEHFGYGYFRNKIFRYFHFRPQSEFILSADGYCMVDKLISFDNLTSEVATMLNIDPDRIGHDNQTSGTRTDPAHLSRSSVDLLKSLYKRDFELYRNLHSLKDDLYMQRVVRQDYHEPPRKV